jgi:uncharacterized protein YukE
MADLISMDWNANAEALTSMMQAHGQLDQQAQDVQSAFNSMAASWTGASFEAAQVKNNQITQDRAELNRVLQLLYSGFNQNTEDFRASDLQNARLISGA